MRLDECRERLAELEKERTALDSGDEGQRRDLGGRAAALYEELNGLVRLRSSAGAVTPGSEEHPRSMGVTVGS